MMEEEEQFQYEEEEYTTIYRKTKRTKSTTTRKKRNAEKAETGGLVKTEIKLNPFLHGTKGRGEHRPGADDGKLKADYVQKLVKNTLKDSDFPDIHLPNRLFLGQFDSDGDDEDVDKENVDGGNGIEDRDCHTINETSSCTVWRCRKTGRKGFDRFRRIVEFVILAQQVFTVKRSVHLNRRDSILFFMDIDNGTPSESTQNKPKFDANAFKGIGQKTKTASIKSCLDVPPTDRTDTQVNQMIHLMKHFQKFSNYPQAVQSGLCRQGWYAKFDSSKVLVKEGCRADFYYLILSGVAVYRDDEKPVDVASNRPVTSLLKPGDTLGEKEILTNTTRPATVVCKEDVEVLGVDRDTLLAIFEASGGLKSIDFLRNLPEFSGFPLELLQTYHFSMSMHYYKRGTVIVKDSKESEWVYIVRTGSCQVYRTVRDVSQSNKDTLLRSTNRNKHRGSNESDKLTLPDINRTKNDKLRSASTNNIKDVIDKTRKKKKNALERSNTVLPNILPGKPSLVTSQRTASRGSNTSLPQIHPSNKDSSTKPKKKKKKSDSPNISRKKYTATPDLQRLSKSKVSHSGTPDSSRTSYNGNQQRSSPESVTFHNIEKDGNQSSGRSWQKVSVSSENDNSRQTPHVSDENVFSSDVEGPLSYVRLDIVSENGVFGLHQLVYEHTPSLSLVSNGAECVLVSKKFLTDHMNDSTIQNLRKLLTSYPGTDQLRHVLDDQANWESYRGKVVDDVVLS